MVVMNHVTMNMGVQISFDSLLSILLGVYMHTSQLLDHIMILFLIA